MDELDLLIEECLLNEVSLFAKKAMNKNMLDVKKAAVLCERILKGFNSYSKISRNETEKGITINCSFPMTQAATARDDDDYDNDEKNKKKSLSPLKKIYAAYADKIQYQMNNKLKGLNVRTNLIIHRDKSEKYISRVTIAIFPTKSLF